MPSPACGRCDADRASAEPVLQSLHEPRIPPRRLRHQIHSRESPQGLSDARSRAPTSSRANAAAVLFPSSTWGTPRRIPPGQIPQEGWGTPVRFGSASTEQALRAHQRHLPGWVRGLPGAGSTGKGGERGLNRRRTIGGSRKQRLEFSFPNPGSEYGFRHGAASDSRVEHGSQLHRAPDHEPRHTAASGTRAGGSGRPLRTCR